MSCPLVWKRAREERNVMKNVINRDIHTLSLLSSPIPHSRSSINMSVCVCVRIEGMWSGVGEGSCCDLVG